MREGGFNLHRIRASLPRFIEDLDVSATAAAAGVEND